MKLSIAAFIFVLSAAAIIPAQELRTTTITNSPGDKETSEINAAT